MCRIWPNLIWSAALFAASLWSAAAPAPRAFDPIPVSHPSLEKVGPVVKSHLQEERQRLESALHSNPPPSPAQLAQAYSRMARVYHAYQFADAALACYQNLDRIQPGIYPCHYAMGWIYHSQGRFVDALHFLVEARKTAQGLKDTPPPVIVAMDCLIGDTNLKLERLAEALNAFQEATQLDSRCAYAWHGMGLVFSIQGKSDSAIECLDRAVNLQPYASVGRALLAQEYRKAGQSGKAAEVARTLNSQRTTPFVFYDPILSRDVMPLNRSAAAMHSRALAARQQGNIQLSVDLLKQTIELNPRFAEAKANLANAYLALNRLDEAETLARQVRDDQPDNASFCDLLGVTLLKRGKFGEACNALQRAQQLEPNHWTHEYWMGAALSWQGKYQDALTRFQSAAKLNDTDGAARIAAAVMTARLGRSSEAMDELRRCLERFPETIQAKLNYAQCLSAYPDSTRDDGEQALALVLPIYARDKSVPVAVSIAMAYAAAGNFSKSVEIQQWAVDHATEQGYAFDAAWLKRNLVLYREGKPSREPWNKDRGFPAIEGLSPTEKRP